MMFRFKKASSETDLCKIEVPLIPVLVCRLRSFNFAVYGRRWAAVRMLLVTSGENRARSLTASVKFHLAFLVIILLYDGFILLQW